MKHINCPRGRARAASPGVLAIVILLSLGEFAPALALTFSVTPVRVFLSARDHSQTLTLRNESEHEINFQLSAFAWDQQPDGTMALTPTDDVIFFPVMLALQPGQERKVRVGSMVPAGPTEKTFRLFVEELAPVAKTAVAGNASVRFLTKVGLPIFVEPSELHEEGSVQNLKLENGVLSFEVANLGNVQFTIQSLLVKGLAQNARPAFSRETPGWYVLAHGTRRYELKIPQADCRKLDRVDVQVQKESGAFSGTFEVPPNSCGSATPSPAIQAQAF